MCVEHVMSIKRKFISIDLHAYRKKMACNSKVQRKSNNISKMIFIIYYYKRYPSDLFENENG